MFTCFDFVQLWESKFFLTYLLGRLFHKGEIKGILSPLLFLILGKLQIRAIFFFLHQLKILWFCSIVVLYPKKQNYWHHRDILSFLSVSVLTNEQKYKHDGKTSFFFLMLNQLIPDAQASKYPTYPEASWHSGGRTLSCRQPHEENPPSQCECRWQLVGRQGAGKENCYM